MVGELQQSWSNVGSMVIGLIYRLVKACLANIVGVADHEPQPKLENHCASLGKQWTKEICEGGLYEYLGATQLAKLSAIRRLTWPRPQIPL